MNYQPPVMSPETREVLRRFAEWHYRTYIRTTQRYAMVCNQKTAEILDDMIIDEILRKHMKV